ncbi:MAG: hypothetical protein PHT37_08395 [Candidatus Cloacimonetes bacterium]|nr:hypothetical protein [Candidatus Cloacimonadota bacterium]MDD2423499.1 hypothetical protein [Candidatus Cloacimonadota bacterium]MDD3562045.1 hypothetical protein [Candidatus Cloacimonadota bacterium]MDD4277892.1 hypothetical protein [Candidatus Cloacimonadota bacterium]
MNNNLEHTRQMNSGCAADSSLLASALYAKGYHQDLKAEYYGAPSYPDDVVKLDALYENYSGIGYALWLRARAHKGNKDSRQAVADCSCTSGSFSHFENAEMIARTDSALKRLEGERL